MEHRCRRKNFTTILAYGTFKTYDGVVVRHHDEKYISDVLSDFEQLEFKKYVFATMNGSESNGFAFVGNVKSDVQNIYDNATFITENVTKEEYRGKGNGKSAFVKLQEDAKEKGFAKKVLNCFKHTIYLLI